MSLSEREKSSSEDELGIYDYRKRNKSYRSKKRHARKGQSEMGKEKDLAGGGKKELQTASNMGRSSTRKPKTLHVSERRRGEEGREVEGSIKNPKAEEPQEEGVYKKGVQDLRRYHCPDQEEPKQEEGFGQRR